MIISHQKKKKTKKCSTVVFIYYCFIFVINEPGDEPMPYDWIVALTGTYYFAQCYFLMIIERLSDITVYQ